MARRHDIQGIAGGAVSALREPPEGGTANFSGRLRIVGTTYQISSAADMEKTDSMVESTMAGDARSVSLFSWAEST